MVRFCLQVHATAHDVFPTVIKQKETIKSIMVPVDDPNVEVMEQETPSAPTTQQPTSPKSSFIAVSLCNIHKNYGEAGHRNPCLTVCIYLSNIGYFRSSFR